MQISSDEQHGIFKGSLVAPVLQERKAVGPRENIVRDSSVNQRPPGSTSRLDLSDL